MVSEHVADRAFGHADLLGDAPISSPMLVKVWRSDRSPTHLTRRWVMRPASLTPGSVPMKVLPQPWQRTRLASR